MHADFSDIVCFLTLRRPQTTQNCQARTFKKCFDIFQNFRSSSFYIFLFSGLDDYFPLVAITLQPKTLEYYSSVFASALLTRWLAAKSILSVLSIINKRFFSKTLTGNVICTSSIGSIGREIQCLVQFFYTKHSGYTHELQHFNAILITMG